MQNQISKGELFLLKVRKESNQLEYFTLGAIIIVKLLLLKNNLNRLHFISKMKISDETTIVTLLNAVHSKMHLVLRLENDLKKQIDFTGEILKINSIDAKDRLYSIEIKSSGIL